MIEKTRRGVPNGAANSVKLTETANTVDSLAVQVECLARPGNIQVWLRLAVMSKMHTGHDASPILVASDVQVATNGHRNTKSRRLFAIESTTLKSITLAGWLSSGAGRSVRS